MLRKFRRHYGFTPAACYRACGINQSTWSRLELGGQWVSVYTLASISLGLRELVKSVHGHNRVREYELWVRDLMALVRAVELERREEK